MQRLTGAMTAPEAATGLEAATAHEAATVPEQLYSLRAASEAQALKGLAHMARTLSTGITELVVPPLYLHGQTCLPSCTLLSHHERSPLHNGCPGHRRLCCTALGG